MRLNDSAITMDELEAFEKKIRIVKENEGLRGETKFYFWLVTNANSLEDGVEDYARKTGIGIMRAKLSDNWQKRSDWSVVDVLRFEQVK